MVYFMMSLIGAVAGFLVGVFAVTIWPGENLENQIVCEYLEHEWKNGFCIDGNTIIDLHRED